MSTTLAERAHSHARDRRMAALWYAWGQQGAGIAPDLEAWTFADEHATDADDYYNERTSCLPSITDAWRTFCARHGVTL